MKNLYTIFFALLIPIFACAQTWTAQNLNYPQPLQGIDVEAVNANVAWTIGMPGDFASSPWNVAFDGHYFSRTADGGTTWISGTFPSTGAGWTANISAVSADLAWLTFVDFGDGNHIFKTIDGGANWTNQSNPINVWINFVHFWDGTSGLAMGDPDSLGFQIAATGNGGTSWVRINPASIPLNLPGEFSINDMYTVAGNKVWFATNYGRVYYSTNKGYNWQVHDSGFNAFPDGLTCSENGHCLFSFGDYSDTVNHNHKLHLLHSSDFGATWAEVTPTDSGWAVWGMQYIPGADGIVLALFRHNNVTGPFETRLSQDNGLTWQTVDSGTETLRLDFASPTVGWATEYKNSEDPTKIFQYTGSPLVGLFAPNKLDAEITLSPNPASGVVRIHVQAQEAGDFWILLNDGQGKLLKKEAVNGVSEFEKTWNIKNLPAGNYTLTITGAKGSLTRQLAKQ